MGNDKKWVGEIREKVRRCEIEVQALRAGISALRSENQACRIELKNDIHNLAKWRERLLVYMAVGGFVAMYVGKHALNTFFIE